MHLLLVNMVIHKSQYGHAQIAGEPVLDLLPSNTNLEAFKTSISNRTTQIGYDIYVRKAQPISEYH